MKTFCFSMLVMIVAVSPAAAQTSASPSHDGSAHYMKFQSLKWEKLVPAEGDHSPEITILHVDPQTGATQLLIRSPKNYHAPKHWHTANETHTVVSGTFIMKDEGGKVED
jgi:hypothetical protein